MAYYVRDNNNNLIEGLSKEEIYALLDEAIRTGQLPSVDDETAFVTKLKCSVTGVASSVAFITEAKYNELRTGGLLKANTLYFITDDTTEDTLENAIAQAKQEAVNEAKVGMATLPEAYQNTNGYNTVELASTSFFTNRKFHVINIVIPFYKPNWYNGNTLLSVSFDYSGTLTGYIDENGALNIKDTSGTIRTITGYQEKNSSNHFNPVIFIDTGIVLTNKYAVDWNASKLNHVQ